IRRFGLVRRAGVVRIAVSVKMSPKNPTTPIDNITTHLKITVAFADDRRFRSIPEDRLLMLLCGRHKSIKFVPLSISVEASIVVVQNKIFSFRRKRGRLPKVILFETVIVGFKLLERHSIPNESSVCRKGKTTVKTRVVLISKRRVQMSFALLTGKVLGISADTFVDLSKTFPIYNHSPHHFQP